MFLSVILLLLDLRGIATGELYHGRIMHGRQLMHPNARRIGTSYYGEESGVGAALRFHPRRLAADMQGRNLNVGIVGLGAGAISVHGIRGDTIRFYEIDPHVEQVARDFFSFLDDSNADVDVVIGDARVSLQREFEEGGSKQFDVLVLDAFSSDAIPVHLLTTEAFDLYRSHLRDDGIIALHITNEYIDLRDLVRTAAREIGMSSVWIEGEDDYWYLNSNDWVLVTANTQFMNRSEVRDLQTDWYSDDFDPVTWTDDFSNLFELIDWGT